MNEFLMARLIQRHVLKRECVVVVDRCQWAGSEADLLAVTKDLRLIDIEIKISRADLKADTRKNKWWDYGMGSWQDGKWVRPEPQAALWPHSIWKHYYALPESVWKDELLSVLPSAMSGVILIAEANGSPQLARVVRRSKPNANAKPISPTQALDIARLANLRMWDAYAQLARAQLERPGMAA